jgi:hypothetical protein
VFKGQAPVLSTPPQIDPVSAEEISDLRVLRDALPTAVALSQLLDRRVRITRNENVVTASEGGHVWVIVGLDQRQAVHQLGQLEVRAAVSQRPGGPTSIGTRETQWLLDVGQHAVVGDYVVYVVARGAGGVSYAIIDRVFWRPSV